MLSLLEIKGEQAVHAMHRNARPDSIRSFPVMDVILFLNVSVFIKLVFCIWFSIFSTSLDNGGNKRGYPSLLSRIIRQNYFDSQTNFRQRCGKLKRNKHRQLYCLYKKFYSICINSVFIFEPVSSTIRTAKRPVTAVLRRRT